MLASIAHGAIKMHNVIIWQSHINSYSKKHITLLKALLRIFVRNLVAQLLAYMYVLVGFFRNECMR